MSSFIIGTFCDFEDENGDRSPDIFFGTDQFMYGGFEVGETLEYLVGGRWEKIRVEDNDDWWLKMVHNNRDRGGDQIIRVPYRKLGNRRCNGKPKVKH